MYRRALPRLLLSFQVAALAVGGVSCASSSPTSTAATGEGEYAGPSSGADTGTAGSASSAKDDTAAAPALDASADEPAPPPPPEASAKKNEAPPVTTPTTAATATATATASGTEKRQAPLSPSADKAPMQAAADAKEAAKRAAASATKSLSRVEMERNRKQVGPQGTIALAEPVEHEDADGRRDGDVEEGGTFVHAGTNPFIDTRTDALSTFSIDVDTGSFTFARRHLKNAALPPDSSVRVEEWVNAMHYSYAGPAKTAEMPFAVHVEGAPSPIAKGKHLVRVALQGKKVSKAERGPTHLVFLVDVSGSMGNHDKLPLAQEALHMMVDELRDDDSIALVTYAGATGVVLPATSVKNKRAIHDAIDKLNSGGGTNMGSGMELAYREAAKQLGGGRSARVVVLSDGDANIGRTSHQNILQSVKGYVSEGVMMSTVGFGTGNYNDHLMEQLADAGNGNYTYIDSKKSAERFFVHELDGTLETIAQDVKIQVEWNPSVVSRYRLVGYENRDIADKDFRNDKKDAGEIGAGHAVTALYEVELTSHTPTEALGTVRIRAKKPRGTKAAEIAVAIGADSLKERPGDLDSDAQTAAAVALAAEILRRSPYAEGRTLSEAAAILREAANGPYAEERLELARDLMRVEPAVARR